MLRNKKLISFLLLSLYLVVFFHNSIPHCHDEGHNHHDVSFNLSSEKESVLSNLVNSFGALAHIPGDDQHMTHILIQSQHFEAENQNVKTPWSTIDFVHFVHPVHVKSTLNKCLYDNQGDSYFNSPYFFCSGLRAPPALV